jgi:hypothetical protein
MKTPSIATRDAHHFEVEDLPRNEAIWLDVKPFSLYIKRTDEGIVVDIHPERESADGECIASTCAFDADALPDEEGGDQ